jgi:hypothetical protein
MTPKKIITALLLLFVLASLGYLAYKEFGGGMPAEGHAAASKVEAEPAGREVRVYYFYTNTRCFSCYKIETLTETTLLEDFSIPLEKGIITWRPVNVEEPGNEHYAEDYNLYTKHVIVSEIVDGEEVRWKDLPRVWELLDDEEAFREYVRDELRAYLGEGA